MRTVPQSPFVSAAVDDTVMKAASGCRQPPIPEGAIFRIGDGFIAHPVMQTSPQVVARRVLFLLAWTSCMLEAFAQFTTPAPYSESAFCSACASEDAAVVGISATCESAVISKDLAGYSRSMPISRA